MREKLALCACRSREQNRRGDLLCRACYLRAGCGGREGVLAVRPGTIGGDCRSEMQMCSWIYFLSMLFQTV